MTNVFDSSEIDGVIEDIRFGVRSIEKKLNSDYVMFNIELLEGRRITVEMSIRGFKIVGEGFDHQNATDEDSSDTYEMLNSLLMVSSPAFAEEFNKLLFSKLMQVHVEREQREKD